MALRAAEVRLSPKAEELLTTVAVHRYLTTDQVQALCWPDASEQARRASHVLHQLRGMGLVVATRSRPVVWHCSQAGLIGAERTYRPTIARALGQNRTHTEAVNNVHLAFAKTARSHGDTCGPLDWEAEVALGYRPGQRPDVIADGLLRYVVSAGDEDVWREAFVELHRGTYPLGRLMSKLRAYVSVRSRVSEWSGRFPGAFPPVLVVMDHRDARRMLAGALVHWEADLELVEGDLEVYMATMGDLREVGARAPIWHRIGRPPLDWLGAS